MKKIHILGGRIKQKRLTVSSEPLHSECSGGSPDPLARLAVYADLVIGRYSLPYIIPSPLPQEYPFLFSSWISPV